MKHRSMMGSRLVCVVDTNILVDLNNGSLLPALSHFPHDLVVPDVILEEIESFDGSILTSYGVAVGELSGPQMLEVVRLRGIYAAPSTNDLIALVLAKVRQATLLSGNKHLVNAARKELVPHHGILWLLDLLVAQQVIDAPTAAGSLEMMVLRGAWLPEQECKKRIEQWRGL